MANKFIDTSLISEYLRGSPIPFSKVKMIPYDEILWESCPEARRGYQLSDGDLYAIVKEYVGDPLDEGYWVIGCAMPYDEDEIGMFGLALEAFSPGAFNKSMAVWGTQPNRSTSLCTDHTCEITTSLIANLASDINRLKVWEDTRCVKPGLYFAASLEMASPGPQRAFWNQVASETFKGVSVGGSINDDKRRWEVLESGYLRKYVDEYRMREISGVDQPVYKSTLIRALADGIIITGRSMTEDTTMPTESKSLDNKCADCGNTSDKAIQDVLKYAQKLEENANKELEEQEKPEENAEKETPVQDFMSQFAEFKDEMKDFIAETLKNREETAEKPAETEEKPAETDQKAQDSEDNSGENEEKTEEEEDYSVSSDGFVAVSLDDIDIEDS